MLTHITITYFFTTLTLHVYIKELPALLFCSAIRPTQLHAYVHIVFNNLSYWAQSLWLLLVWSFVRLLTKNIRRIFDLQHRYGHFQCWSWAVITGNIFINFPRNEEEFHGLRLSIQNISYERHRSVRVHFAILKFFKARQSWKDFCLLFSPDRIWSQAVESWQMAEQF